MPDKPDLSELRAAAEAATPGPWSRDEFDRSAAEVCTVGVAGKVWQGDMDLDSPEGAEADATYIAAMDPTTTLALIEALEVAHQALERGERTLTEIADFFGEQGDQASKHATGMDARRINSALARISDLVTVTPEENDG